MKTYTEALSLILEAAEPTEIISCPLEALRCDYLAAPLVAPFELPRFDNSAMDGYGVRVADVASASESEPVALNLVAGLEAGDDGSAVSLAAGEAVRIMTGAPVPSSVEAVVMREFCREQDGNVFVLRPARLAENIRRAGEELRAGAEVLPAGTRITPPVVGLLASFGMAEAAVHRKPRVAVIATGSELVTPGEATAPGQIFDSNSYALAAAVESLGFERPTCHRVADSRAETADCFARALAEADVVISAGGVSVGDKDFVKAVLEEELGVRTILWRIAIKPGKPVYAGVCERDGRRRLVFGLPGNPVSALVTFRLFVCPALRKMQGAGDIEAPATKAKLTSALKKKAGRQEFVRAFIESGDDAALYATPTKGQDSHMLSGLARADALLSFPLDSAQSDVGDILDVKILNWER